MNFDLTPDQEQLQALVRDFAEGEVAPIAEKLDRDGVFPTELFKKLGDIGVMSIPFAEKHGGMGLGVFEAVLAIEEVARADQSLAVSAMVSMATGLTVARFGSEQLAEKWLPEIVTGQKMCAIAGTEPDAGSDTAGFKTRSRLAGDDRWVINGEKAFITNAGTDLSIFTLLLDRQQPRRRREEAVHAVSGAKRRQGLHPRREVPQARLALVRHASALFRRLPCRWRPCRRRRAQGPLGAAQGLSGRTAFPCCLLARPGAGFARSFDQIRQGAAGRSADRSAGCN